MSVKQFRVTFTMQNADFDVFLSGDATLQDAIVEAEKATEKYRCAYGRPVAAKLVCDSDALETMRQTTVKAVKKGDYVKFKAAESAPVWVRGEYCRESKKYGFHAFDDVNREMFKKADFAVFVGFTF